MKKYVGLLAFAIIIEFVAFAMLVMGLIHITNQFYEVAEITQQSLDRNILLVEQNERLVEENAELTKKWLDAGVQCLKDVVQVCCDEGGTVSEGD